MPNWTENSLLIRKKDWDKFKEVAWNDAENEVTFSKLLPHPKEMEIDEYYNLAEHFKHEEECQPLELSDDWFKNKQGEQRQIYNTMKELKLCVDGWYEWNCKHWGTKWDACDTQIYNEDEIDELDDDDQVCVIFNTAWSAPEPWYQKLSEIIPFESECTEEGGFFHIIITGDGEGGINIEDDTEEYFSNQEEEE